MSKATLTPKPKEPVLVDTSGYTSFMIDRYHIELFAREDDAGSINLYDVDHKHVAILIFKPDSETLPAQYQGADGIYRVFYHRRCLPDVIDLLRNEKPLGFHYWLPDGRNTCIANHGSEPVGEAE